MAIANLKDLQLWLEKQPQDVCVAIGFRAVMRVLPLALIVEDDGLRVRLVLSSLRAALTSGVCAACWSPDARIAAMATGQEIEHLRAEVHSTNPEALPAYASDTMKSVAFAAFSVDLETATDPKKACESVAAAIQFSAAGAQLASTSEADVEKVARADACVDAETIAASSINDPISLSPLLEKAVRRLHGVDANALVHGQNQESPWAFWARWYERAMAGNPLPWDLQEQIALIPDEIWESGPEAVAEEIARIEAEFYEVRLNRPDTVPETQKAVLSELVQGFLAAPEITAEFAQSSAETVERAIQEYLNASGENCLPTELIVLEGIPHHFQRIAQLLVSRRKGDDLRDALVMEIEALNLEIARLEADLKVARSKSLEGRFKTAAVENLAKTVTSPWMIGALGYGACHFFGWTPSGWTLANLRGFAEDLLKLRGL